MNSGEFDRLLTFKVPTGARGSAGSQKYTWADNAELSWAKYMPATSSEVDAALARYTTAAGVMRIRYRSDVTASWRFTIDGAGLYELVASPVEVGRREYLDLAYAKVLVP